MYAESFRNLDDDKPYRKKLTKSPKPILKKEPVKQIPKKPPVEPPVKPQPVKP